LRKRSIIFSVLCLLLALPSGALAQVNEAQTPQLVKVERGKQVTGTAAAETPSIAALADDIFGPILDSATVSPTSVGVGETITITANASDESGVAEVVAYLNLPNAQGFKTLPLVFDNEAGAWKGTYTITDLDPEGTWIIDFDMYDSLGNSSYGAPIEPVQVTNPNGDTELPTLGEVAISPLSIGPNEEFTIRATVNDNKGVASVYAAVYTADSTGYYYLPLTLAEATGQWAVTHSFTETDISGNWYFDIVMTDIAGNYDWITRDEVLVLTNPFSDYTAPVIGEAVITPATASPGQSVQLRVPVTDEQSGVSYVYAEFSHIDSPLQVYGGPLTLDEASGEWVMDLAIENSFPSGVWEVVIYATDNAGISGFKEFPTAFDVINTEGDFEAPVISSVQVTQGEVQVGDTVTVSAAVTDNVGVDSVEAYIYSQNGFGEFITMTFDQATGQYIGNFVVQDTTPPDFYMAYVNAYDTSFRFNFAYAEGGFTVVNTVGDFTGPVISDIQLDKTDVNAGEQVTLSATVEDAGSGVAYVLANYYDGKNIVLKFDSTLGKWIGTITVPTNIPDGETININYIDAVDMKGNISDPIWYPASFTVHNPDGDYTAPVVASLEMTPATAKVGETVQFKANVTDDKTGVNHVSLSIGGSFSSFADIDLTLDQASGLWTGSYTVKANDRPGEFIVQLTTGDNNGNSGGYVSDQRLTIDNPTADVTSPVVAAVDVTPAEANVGDTVTISADITDEQSGVHGAYASLESPGYETYQSISLIFNEETNKWEGTYVVKEFDIAGSWHVNVTAFDNAGNYGSNEAEAQFTVVNPDGGDSVSPTVDSFVMTPTTAKPGDTVHFEAKLTDDKSGVKSAAIYLYNNTGAAPPEITLSYDEVNDVWAADYVIPAYAGLGFHSVNLDVEDHAGNWNYYNPAQSLLILNENPDNEAPKFASLTLTPEKALEGDEVTFKVNFTDNQSGVKNASLILFNPDSANSYNADDERAYRFIDLTYNETEDSWIGTYTVKATDPLGSWKISYQVDDLAGNWDFAAMAQRLVVYSDITPPVIPTVSEVSDQSTEVSGTTEAGAAVTVSIGEETYTGTADESGNFAITIPVQAAGTVITVSAKDAFGNASEGTTITVVDKTAPAAPTVSEVSDQSTEVSGTTEAGASVTVSIGEETFTGTADESGNFSIAIPVQAAGTSIAVTAKDASNNVSGETTVTVVDKTAPAAPTVAEVGDQSTEVTGTTEAGATITVLIGTETYTGTADETGNFAIEIPVQVIGTVITVTSKDASNNVSGETKVTVADKTPPAAPTVNTVTSKSGAVIGRAEPGATVTVSNGTASYTGTASTTVGYFNIPIPSQREGTKLTVTATDNAGNVSPASTVVVEDKTGPAITTVNTVSSKSEAVIGRTEPGAVVTVKSGTNSYTGTASSTVGYFKITIPIQKEGTKLTVTATDAAGNIGPGYTVIVEDKTGPIIEKINTVTSLSRAIIGSTEPGATVTVKIGTVVYTGTGSSTTGYFKIAIPFLKPGTKITVNATDKAGNVGPTSTVYVEDKTAPPAPKVNTVTDRSGAVIGTAERGSTVTIMIGTVSYTGTASSTTGYFKIAIPFQSAGTIITVTAKDAAGNVSAPTTVTVID
jgi:hypothetical protein